jgi:IS5 family transposase
MQKKITYKVKNWKQYNRSLINRGNLTLWFSEDAVKSWHADNADKKGRGRRFTYSDTCIELALTLRTLFHFPLRSTQGFLEGLVSMLKLNLKVPHYSRLSRRAADLKIGLQRLKSSEKIDLVIDSTGLKIYGEGEWKVRTHGKQKRRVWRKYHVAVEPKTHEVVAVELTESNVHDCNLMGPLLSGIDEAGNIYADGAYTHPQCFAAIARVKAKPFIPVRTGTTIKRGDVSDGLKLRNQLIRDKRAAGGKVPWKKISGYHKRSLVETHMFRLKKILGGGLRARKTENQKVEARIMAAILNQMTKLGMPKTCRVEN